MDKNKFKNPSSIRIRDDLKQWLLRQAFEEKRTMGNLINKILQEYKEEKEGFITIKTLCGTERIKRVTGGH